MSEKFCGKLSWREFLKETKEFLDISTQLNDGWRSRNIKGDDDDVDDADCYYLEKRIIVSANVETDEGYLAEEFEEVDTKTVSTEPYQYVTYEYHITYSIAYFTPVLYLTAWKQDGQLLSLEELWERVPFTHHDLLSQHKWSILTQQEHPILRRPYYVLHPCHTADLVTCAHSSLDGATNPRFNYLVTWLSSVGPIVGLKISLDYCKLLNN